MCVNNNGVSPSGTPFFLLLIFFLSIIWSLPCHGQADEQVVPSANGSSLTSTINKKNGPDKVIIHADELIYFEGTERLSAKGHVQVWYQSMTLTADRAEADLETQLVKAYGNVTLRESGRDIKCTKLDYNLETKSAKASGILFAESPWYYQGESVEKIGDSKVIIKTPLFTTCDTRQPHFHLKAREIEIIMGDALIAHDVTLYVGNTPVLYLPWFRRSLDDNRPPFSIELGYNDFEGMFAKITYNYFLSKKNYGGILLNLMEKKGLGTGLDHYLDYTGLGDGHSELHFLYIADTEAESEQITAKFGNTHRFSKKDELKINLDYLSSREFNRNFSSALVDSYQQRSTMYYSHRDSQYNFTLGLQENLSYDPLREKYYPSTRELPSANLSLFSREIAKVVFPVYFSMNMTANRTFPRIITNVTEENLNGSEHYRYFDQFSTTPSVRQTYVFPISIITQPSLSWSLGTPLTGSYKENLIDDYSGDSDGRQAALDAAYRTSITLSNKWVNYRYTKPTHLLESKLTHNFERKFDLLYEQTLDYAGISSHNLNLRVDYDMGSFFHNDISSTYDLLKIDDKKTWYEPISNPLVNGRLTLFDNYNLNWQGTYHWEINQFSSANVGVSHTATYWNANINVTYNGIIQRDFSTNTIVGIDDSVFISLNAGIQPKNWGLGLRTNLQFDAITKEFTNFSLSASRDVHCWSLQGGFKIYQDGNIQLGLGINIKAFPDVKAGFGGY